MKLFRKNSSILCMAYSRKQIEDRAKFFQNDIADHIMKCVIYSSNYPDFSHWVSEIAVHIFKVAQMTPKKGLRIKASDYQSWIFDGFGDDFQDAQKDLDFFHVKYVVKASVPYPDFNVTSDLCMCLFEVVVELKKLVSSNMPYYNSKSQIETDLHSVLDRCCQAPWLLK